MSPIIANPQPIQNTQPQQLTFDYGKILGICISTRNNVLNLKEQLQNFAQLPKSVLEHLEIIVVDNDSTDGTSNMIREFEGRLEFAYEVNTDNLGPDNSFFTALQAAIDRRTKYVWMLDARNIIRIEHMEEFLQLLDTNEAGLIHLATDDEAKKPSEQYIDVDDFLQLIGMDIVHVSRNIFRTDLLRGYNNKEFGAGTGIPAVPLFLHVCVQAKQNIVYFPPLYTAGNVELLNEVADPVRTFVKNILTIYDRYEDKVHSISPYTTRKLKSKIADFINPLSVRLIVFRKGVKEIDAKVSRAIIREHLGPVRPLVTMVKHCFTSRIWGRTARVILNVVRKIVTVIVALTVMLICNTLVTNAWRKFKTNLTTFRFGHRVRVGKKSVINGPVYTAGNKYIYIGSDFTCQPGMHLECINTGYCTPKIHIGDYVTFDANVRINSVQEVRIGNNVQVGRNVLITNYQQGKTSPETLRVEPSKRSLCLKGNVQIEDNVIIGPNVVILGGVTIGKGAVIGAGAVVTHDIPALSVAVGVPAKVRR